MAVNSFRRFLFGLAALVITISCRTAPPDRGGEQKSSYAKASLRLKWVYDPGFAGELVAARLGLFEKHNLEVTIRPGGFEADPIRLVATGSDTFGVAGADVFLMARQRGIPLVAFAAGYLQTPVTFYVHQSSGIHSPADFPGHRVGYQAGQDTATVYEALLRKLAVDRNRITEIPVKYDFTPFLTNRLDVWPGYAATQSYILERQHIPYSTIVPSDYSLSHLGTVYFTREDVIQRNPQLVQAFVDGLIQGWEATYSDQNRAVAAISAYDPNAMPDELVRFNLIKQKSFIVPPGRRYCEFAPEDWNAIASTLTTLRMLTTGVSNSAVSYRFLVQHYGQGR